MTNITSIEQLIETFDNTEPEEQVSVLKRIEIPIAEFEKFATWKDGCYTRNCLVRNEDFEFILLCWDLGSLTPVHGHDEKDCWVYQVSGKLKESRFKEIETGFELTNEMELNAGQITYMHDRMGYHKIENLSNQRAMSLHVYACPIDTCKIYNEKLSQFEIKQMEYDSVAKEAVSADV